MSLPPQPPAPYQQKVDADHLKLLVIFHYIIAGLALLGTFILIAEYFFFTSIFSNPAIWKDAKGGPPPVEVLTMFKWLFPAMALIALVMVALNILSAVFLHGRKNRTFSLIVAGIDCLQFPFGTGLGVFTFIVLMRESVRALYEAGAVATPPPLR
jgi:hypothetical protein